MLSGIERADFMAKITQAVPVLRVADVGRSIEWYRANLGFEGDPFPPKPPFQFAILRNGETELMLRRGTPPARSAPSNTIGMSICDSMAAIFVGSSPSAPPRASSTAAWSKCSTAWPNSKSSTPTAT